MWVKFRHKLFFALLRPLFRIFLFFKYGFRCSKFRCGGIKPPYLILSNHVTTLDPFMVAVSFDLPVYFVASDDLFSIRYASYFIKKLVAPIPKTKSASDLKTIKDCYRVAKEGGTICIFPEGNRTYNGVTSFMPFAIVKLVKFLKLPLLLYKIEGGYGVEPRWAANIRKGITYGSVQRVLTYEEYKDMSDHALFDYITETLKSNAYEEAQAAGSLYKSKNRAEYAERFLYACPDCKSFSTLKSEGSLIRCEKCGMTAQYGENLGLTSVQGSCPFKSLKEWDDFQKDLVRAYKISDTCEKIFLDEGVLLRRNRRAESKTDVGTGTLSLSAEAFEFCGTSERGDIKMTFLLSEVSAAAAQGKNKLVFYYRDEIYQCKGGGRFNPIKYVNMFYHIKNTKEGVSDEFLGL